MSLVNFIVVGPQVAGFEAGGLIGPFAYGPGNWLDIQVTGEGPIGTVRMSVTLE